MTPRRFTPPLPLPTFPPSDTRTVDAARAEVGLNLQAGKRCTCPVCNKLIDLRRQTLHGEMIVIFDLIVRHYLATGEAADTRTFIRSPTKKSTDAAYMRQWKLLRYAIGESGKELRSHYLPTEEGLDWWYGRIVIPDCGWSFNNVFLAWSENYVTIREAVELKLDVEAMQSKFELPTNYVAPGWRDLYKDNAL
jgi:hypothetical protein